MSLEETLAILGTLGKPGIQGSEDRYRVTSIAHPERKQNPRSFKRYSVLRPRMQGNARDLVDILGEVATASANMGTGDRAQATSTKSLRFDGITSASAIGKTVTDTKKLLADLKKSNGYRRQDRPRHGCGNRWSVSNLKKFHRRRGHCDRRIARPLGHKNDERNLSGSLRLIEWIGKNQEVVKKVALIVAGVVAVGAAFIGSVALLVWPRSLLVA